MNDQLIHLTLLETLRDGGTDGLAKYIVKALDQWNKENDLSLKNTPKDAVSELAKRMEQL